MKIAVWHNLPSGGGKRALFGHVQGLLALGHEVRIWTPPTADETYLPLSGLAPVSVLPLEDPGGGALSAAMRFREPAAPFIRAMENHSALAAEQMSGFDVLLAAGCQRFYAPCIGRFFGGRKLLYLQEPNRPLYEALPRLPWLHAKDPTRMEAVAHGYRLRLSQGLAETELENANSFDRVLCNSFFSRESILRAYGLSAEVCYLGLDTAFFTDRSQAREALVYGVGSFHPAKRIDLAIRAVAGMPGKPPLIWIGNAEVPGEVARLSALAAELGVDFQARLMLGDEEIVEIANRASLMIYAPSLEPFGLAPLEANACGVPVLALAEGGLRETIRPGINGWLASSERELLALATHLGGSPQEIEELRGSSRAEAVERWSSAEASRRLEGHLLQLVGAA